MDSDTFCARKKDTPKLKTAIQRGRAKWHDDCVARLTRHAEKSFVPALFILKSRFGYIDGSRTEVIGAAGGPLLPQPAMMMMLVPISDPLTWRATIAERQRKLATTNAELIGT